MNPLIFLDAQRPSSMFLTGTRVDEWVDANGSGRSVATSTILSTAYNPVFNSSLFGGKGGISFNGNEYLESPAAFPELNWTRGFTFMMAGTFKSGFFAAADAVAIICGAGLGTRLGIGTAANSMFGLPLIPCVFGFSWDGFVGSFILNGEVYPVTQGGISPGSGAFGNLQIGGIIGAAGGMAMDVAGIQIWNEYQDESEIFNHWLRLQEQYGIENHTPPKYGIVVDGNSLAVGYWSDGITTMWDGVKGISGAAPLDMINVATGGLETPSMIDRAASLVDPLLDKFVPSKRRVLIVWEITNDLANLTQTDTAAYNNIKAYCQARKAAGWKVVVCTCLPRTQTGINANFESYRLSVNSSINANAISEGWADAVADIGGDATIGQTDDSNNTTYFNDKIHLTAAGHAIAKDYITAALTTVIA